MKTIWTGAIGFGLVNIPVKLFSATNESRLDLDMLDKKDHSNIKFHRVNEKTGKEVAWGNIVKGYKIDDAYVILEDKDFEKANAKKTKTIEIIQFVQEDEIDSLYFETPYYLEPDKSGGRAYALLREALRKSKKVGVASYVLRNKEALCILKPVGDAIVLNKIRFQQEILEPDTLQLPAKSQVKEGEMKMALSLIEQLTETFDISKYKDTYTDELMKVIKAKAKGTVVKSKSVGVKPTATKDLMAQLKASLGSAPVRKTSSRARVAASR
jgi:DNA end-binding protein Ku